MNELSPNVKVAFTRIGVVYTIFSVASTVLQLLILNLVHFMKPEIMTVNAQVMISSCILYILGIVILGLGFKGTVIPVTNIEKHKMKPLDFLKAFCMCYSLLIASNLAGIIITTIIGMVKGSPVVNPVETLAMEMSLPVMFFFTVVCAPIFEELFFRKIIIDRTVQFGEVPSMLISGFMFGLFHGNLSQFPYAFTIGVFFGYIYIRTGRIGYSMLLHAIVNFMGSIAGAVVLKGASLDTLTQLESIATEAEALELLQNLLTDGSWKGLVLLLVYELLIMILVVVGLILWIMNWKKIRFGVQKEEMPKGNRFVAVMANYGMIAYLVVWIAMIIYNTIIGV